MPPDPQRNKLQTESERARLARQLAEESNRRAAEIATKNASPAGRSEAEKVASPTLAERILPGHPRGQQYLRQGVDTLTSAAGGALGGGLPGALLGGAASLGAFALNPDQAQEIGSFTNLANLAIPGAVRGIQALKPVANALKNYPGLTGGALGFLEGGAQGAATGVDTGNSPAELGIGQGLINAVLRGGSQHMQSGGREIPAAVSPDIRKGIRQLSEQAAGPVPPGTNAQGLLDALTRQMSKYAPYLRSPEQEAAEAMKEQVARTELSDVWKNLRKSRTALKGAETKAATAAGEADIAGSEITQATQLERARSRDFLKSYPAEAKRLDTELAELGKPNNRASAAGQAAYDQALARKAQLDQEFQIATRNSGNEARLRENVTLAQQKAAADIGKPVRDASLSVADAKAEYATNRKEVQRLTGTIRSFVTSEAARNKAIDDLVALGSKDPRTFTPEARQTIRELVKSPGFSGESLFKKTVEAPAEAEKLSKNIMEAIGSDSQTKAALRSRYVQHIFDTLQEGFDDSVNGKTFNPEHFEKWMTKVKANSRAFNEFMENPDAYETLYKLAERLRKGAQGLNNPSLGIHLGWGAAGMGAYVGGHMVGSDSGEDTGGLMLRMAGAGLGAAGVSKLLGWKGIANNLLQAKGFRAKAIQKFLEADDPSRLPQDTVKIAVRAMYGDDKPARPTTPARTSQP